MPSNRKMIKMRFMNLSHRRNFVCTSEAQLAVTESCVVCRAFLLHFSSTSAALHAFIKLGPAVSSCVFLQPLFLRSSVLEPHLTEIVTRTAALSIISGGQRAQRPKTLHQGRLFYLHHPHVQPRLGGQLLSDMACRLWRVFVGTFESLKLLCGDGGPRSFGPGLRII